MTKIRPEFAADTKDAIEIVKIAIKTGFMTGSRRFGLEHEKSDYDFVVRVSNFKGMINIGYLNEYRLKHDGNEVFPTLGFKIYLKDKKFNLLVTTRDTEYDAWEKSTNQFLELLENDVFKEVMSKKETRVSFFERLREINGIGDS